MISDAKRIAITTGTQRSGNMTIEEAIKHGKEQLHIFGKCDHADFIKCSIDTMRKYKKIVEIVSNYGFDTSWLCLKKIREVLEDDARNI